MFGHQEGKVRVVRLLCRILIAVAVDGDNAVGILIDHDAPGIHAEGAHPVLELLGPVDDLALIELIRQVGKQLRRKLHPDADVHAVRLGRNPHRLSASICFRFFPRR